MDIKSNIFDNYKFGNPVTILLVLYCLYCLHNVIKIIISKHIFVTHLQVVVFLQEELHD